MRKSHLLSLVSLAAIAAVTTPALAQSDRPYTPVTADMIMNPDPADWLQWRRTVDNQGHSTLDQINRDNASDLDLAWAWPMGELGQQELAPIVHDGIMILATNLNYVEALDAATGDFLWSYQHTMPTFAGGYHQGQSTRQKNSVAFWGENVILTTVDAKLMALNARTGEVVWEQQVLDWAKGYSYTAGPLVADGKIFTGQSGCSITGTAGACWITAHNADTGEELWRFNLLDDPNNPAQGESWNGVPPENRWGATPWATGSYDPDMDAVFYGTGMPNPYSEHSRGTGDGHVLYTNSTVVLGAEDGQLIWYYQHLPRDNWDLDHPYERILVDATVMGQPREMVVTVPGKDGIAFALDRATGDYIWHRETTYQNVVAGVDEKGEVITNVETIPTAFGQAVVFCPAIAGGRLWQATAYSVDTEYLYLPAANTCQGISPGMPNLNPGGNVSSSGPGSAGTSLAPGADEVGGLWAIDVTTGEIAWDIQQDARFTSSVLATAGGLIFVGDANRWVYAMNDETGEVLWQSRMNAPAGGYPMTYAVDGVQYVAVPAGRSNQTNTGQSDTVTNPRGSGNSLFVFALDQ